MDLQRDLGRGASGATDGAAVSARFEVPAGLSMDGGGNLYVADTGHYVIREITAAGGASTLARGAVVQGPSDGIESQAGLIVGLPTVQAIGSRAAALSASARTSSAIEKIAP